MKIVIAPLGGLIGAILGGVLWAKYIQWTGNTAGLIAIGIGLFSGIGMLLTCSGAIEPNEKKQWLMVAIGAAIFSVIGIFIGKYLDVQWNALTQMTEQLIASEPSLTEEAATSMAKTVYSGSSRWEHMKDRMDWFDLLFGSIAVIVAFYITLNPRVRNIISKLSRI
ncbi:MAG: hypothetical protein OXU23_22155 [Candidatus Poribacteria bacterium]|nr:hypothetical protein [Candidatus Poribacteria bacterium]